MQFILLTTFLTKSNDKQIRLKYILCHNLLNKNYMFHTMKFNWTNQSLLMNWWLKQVLEGLCEKMQKVVKKENSKRALRDG